MKAIFVLLTVAAIAALAAYPAGAEARNGYVLCGNFSGQGPAPDLKRRPHSCNVTKHRHVKRLRKMNWSRWDTRARGRGLVDGRVQSVRLRDRRRCGQHGEYKVFSKMSIGGGPFHSILYCGD
jgi:hypothetical protein